MITPLPSLGKTYRHMARYRELIAILMKYGFQDIVEQLNLRYYVELGKSVLLQRPAEHVTQIPRAVRVRLILEEMGTTFIKFGQIMSTRPDFIPEEFIAELKKLQDSVPPFPTPDALALIETELEAPVKELFAEFGDEPIASASIAQVYRAVLHTGEEVAVKVQRPDIQRVIEVDVEIMMNLARLAEAHLKGLEILQPVSMVEEFSRVIDNELNFHVEARNIERFAENFGQDETVQVPRVFHEFSTKRILTIEYIHGIPASDHEKLLAEGYDLPTLALTGANALVRQIFEHGFFHADPHPGNIFVVGPARVCFLDFGMMGKLDRTLQETLAALLVCIVNRDDERLTQSVLHLSTNPDDLRDTRKLRRELTDFVDRYFYVPFDKLKIGEVLEDLLSLIIRFGLKLPPEIYLLIKSLVTIEGVGRDLNPQFDIITIIKPFVERLVKRQYDPRRIASDLGRTTAELYRLLRDLPEEIRALLKFIRRGELRVDLETRSMEPVMKTWDRDANRMSFAIVLAALFVSSALIIHAHVPPLWHGMPVIGIVGFAVAIIMGLWLLIAIFLSGHL
ncbi:hypothetical protein GX586_11880 [bacterium]|nr:hypothetical protein [bacterium]